MVQIKSLSFGWAAAVAGAPKQIGGPQQPLPEGPVRIRVDVRNVELLPGRHRPEGADGHRGVGTGAGTPLRAIQHLPVGRRGTDCCCGRYGAAGGAQGLACS